MPAENMSPDRLIPLSCKILFCTALIACNDGLPTGSTDVADCAAGDGQIHSGTLTGAQMWTRLNGPHLLVDSVVVDGTLTISAGALVCGEPGSVLAPTLLRVDGRATDPVVLTAADSVAGWGGVRLGFNADSDSSRIRYADIRHAQTGVRSYHGGATVLENTIIFRAGGPGILGRHIAARHVVVDSACSRDTSAQCAAIITLGYGGMTLVEPVIRDSRGGGIFVPARSGLALTGGTITGSRGIGLMVQHYIGGSGGLAVHSPVRITDGESIPLSVAGRLPDVLSTREAQLELLGNAVDVVRMVGPYDGPERTVYRELPWELVADCNMGGTIGTVRLEAGATLTVSGCHYIYGRIVGEGTAEDPITIRSAAQAIHAGDADGFEGSIHLRHARIADANFVFHIQAVLEDVEMEQSTVQFLAPGSRLTRARMDASSPVFPIHDAVMIAADDVEISDCTITNSERDGIRVTAGAPRIERCNFENNGGAGVNNTGTAIVDARDNWWGDPHGPAGDNGDGVLGAVTHVPFLVERVVW